MSGRKYEATGVEAQSEPGSRGRVMRNLIGIRRVRDMNEAESQALVLAQEAALNRYGAEHRFTATDVCELHRMWLGPLYEWAGQYRSVNLSKAGFPFANAALIAGLMADFERGPLKRHTPCRPDTDLAVAGALAEVHAELILIHPFREGNGRLARLLALLMALQADLPPLDFGPLTGRGRHIYISGIHRAVDRDYGPLRALFRRVIERSRRRAASSAQ